MKSPRKLLTLLLLAVAVTAAGLAQTFKVIAGKNLALVRQDLQKVFGSDLHFDGLDVSLFPRPSFSVKGISVADDPRFAATPIVRTKELVLGVNLWNLLQGRIMIDSFIFKEPELQIITDETGRVNLTALFERRKGLRAFPRMDSIILDRKPGAVSFAIREIRTSGGRIEYLDRSVPTPAELQIRNIDLTLRGFNPTESMGIHLTAALTDGLSHDMQIHGELGPQEADQSWSQRSMDLAIRFDSLYLPVIARAIAGLRDRFPRALNVTGPMALQAKASGTIERPRIDDFSLKIPLFGSSDYNAVATGAIAFSERRSWTSAEFDGKLSVAAVDLSRLRELPFVEQLVLPAVMAEGAVSIFSRFEGTWATLRVGALLVANQADIRFRDWLHKPAGVVAEIKTGISRRQHKILFHESELVLGAARTSFTGSVETEPVPRLSLQVNGGQNALAGWNQIFAPSAYLATAGSANWRIMVDKSFSPYDDLWNLRGEIKLSGAEFRHKNSGRRIEKLHGRVSFLGRQARMEDVNFRIGSSQFSINGTAADLFEPRVEFQLRSAQLNSADLPALGITSFFQLKDMSGGGQWKWDHGGFRLNGSFSAPEGSFRRIGFRDFRSHFAWSSEEVSFDELSAKIFKGTLRSEGRWTSSHEKTRQLEVRWQADAMDANLLVAELIPPFKDRLEGRLSGHGHLDAASGAGKRDALNGAGETSIGRGVIKDFNLVRQLLLRGSGASGPDETTARWPGGFASLVQGQDTPFESLKANLVFEQQRIRTDNLVLTTRDYTITGAGWVGLDRSTRWNGLLSLSPGLTQDLQRDFRVLRYLLDRRGRLPISFRIEGTIPNVKVRLENRAIAQLLRGATAPEDGSDGERGEAAKSGKNWLPDALKRFLNR